MWNLTKGKVTYHSKLAGEADLVAFHPTGATVRAACASAEAPT